MPHYDIDRWVDFARGFVSEAERVEMETHLNEHCRECAATLQFIQKLAGTAAAEQAYFPAMELTEKAKKIFPTADAVAGSGSRPGMLQRLLAHLIYDSAGDLFPAGARGQLVAPRHVLFAAGDFCLDLRFDREQDASTVTLVGQLANQNDPGYPVASVPVSILSRERTISGTLTNEFGEFALEYQPKRDLRLSVAIQLAGVRLEVPLKLGWEEHGDS